MKLQGAVCIVTGSATGSGAACAIQLARKGARVVVNYSRSEADAKETLQRVRAGGRRSDSGARRCGERRRLPCAGASCARQVGPHRRVDQQRRDHQVRCRRPISRRLSAEDFQRIYAVNVIGPYQMIRACAPSMKQQGSGAVVNISSVSGVVGVGSSTAYVASKGALNVMTLGTGARLGADDSRQHGVPGIDRDALAHGALRCRRLRQVQSRLREGRAARQSRFAGRRGGSRAVAVGRRELW